MPRGSVVSRVVLAVALGLVVAACVVETEPGPRRPLLRDTLRAAAVHDAPPVTVVAASPLPVPDAFRACDVDADCVAVLPNGCCHDGRNEALSKALADAYRSTFTCPTEHPVCPTNLVLDRRVPACDRTAHLCKLVDGPSQ